MTLSPVEGLVGTLASVGGLIFSALAWSRARSAQKAAEEARKAVRQGNAAEDLQRLATKARELLHFIENDQFSAARIRSGDLILDIATARHRWKVFFLSDQSENLAEAARKTGLVTRALSTVEEEIGPGDRNKLVNACREVVSRLAAESGNIQSDIDRRNEHASAD